ncbi:MAG: leucine-rich repeat domain-containing protein, partial [Clostridia bacterium]|nr:leucine-rich repeat domain-containing protein [Clostridia bacterium]
IGLGDLDFNSQILEGFRDLSIIFSPVQGVLAAGDTLLCELHVDSAATEPGLYEVTLQITSNDPDNPVINIPVTIEVTSPLAYIPDDNFRMAINEALGQSSDYQPTVQDLESMTGCLNADQRNISNLEGAQYLSNLTDLNLGYNQISDLSPLANLSNLHYLLLSDNQISDLSALANLSNLLNLHLSENQISDLSLLSDLSNLTYLQLFNNQISDLTPLAGLNNMLGLFLGENQISDISPLAGLSNLYYLWLDRNHISDLSPLANLNNLHSLLLDANQISDISPMANLSNLDTLTLGNNQISDLSPLASLSNLSNLSLQNNPVSNESMLLSQSWSLPWSTDTYDPLSPCYPDPQRAAMGVAPDAGLSWQANYNSSSTALYQVYLGTSSDDLTYIGEGTWVNGTTYSYATNLEPITEYWWRVKAIDGATQIWSGMWSFTTGDLIQNPQIQLTPSAFYETLDVGESSVQYLSIENTGDANLEYSIGIDYSYRTEETLYPNLDSGSISNMQRNGGVDPNPRLGKKITQYPDREGETFNVLVMEEIAEHAYYSLALNNLGIPHTFVNNWNLLQQEMDSTQSWDLIVVNSYHNSPTQQLLDDLAAFVAAGGQLIFADWAIGELYTHALLQDLGIGFISSYTQPKPFTAALASHPIFNTPNQIQELLVTNDQANIDGQVVSVLPGATALAEFSVDPYSSAIVLGANGSSIFNAFQADNFKGDHDEDGKLDILELLENQIVYLLGDYQQAWLSVSPTIGTVEPGTSEMIEIAFDASNISAGVHNSNLIVSSNDPSSAQIIVPVELEVMNIAEAMIEVYPEYIEHSLLQDSTDQVELEISNSGNAALNWTATVEEVRREASAPVATHPRVTAELRPERDSRPGMERYELTKPEESERESSLLRERNVLLTLDPDNGLVEAESSVFCWLNIDSSGSLSGTYEYQIVITSNAVNEPELIIPVSITVEGTPAYIPDDNFRMAINNALEQPADYQPTVQDLESLDYLDAESYGISSLEGAEYLSNLDGLDLAYNQISDLSPLSNLSNLQGLYLDFNQISDLNPLANLSNLQELRLWNNQISDLSPLANMINLQGLEANDNQISDLGPLANLSNLDELDLGYNQISDISPLANLSNLQWLLLYDNQISDLSPLSNLINLYYLNLSSNQISDISPLANLSNLQGLDLWNNQISVLSPLANLSNLQGLYLDGNQISDLGPLANLSNLQWLHLGGNQISDLSPLSNLANLYWLYLDGNQISDISSLSNLSNLQWLHLGNNQIIDISSLANLSNLQDLLLYNNQINDLSPLASLINLQGLDLWNNQISDLSPLANLSNLTELYLENNPLSYESMLLTQSWSLPYSTSTYEPLSPCYPDPEREALDVAPEVGLSWQGNYDSSPLVLYEVYLGSSSDALTYIGEGTWVNGTTYSYATNLEPFTEYWWRV